MGSKKAEKDEVCGFSFSDGGTSILCSFLWHAVEVLWIN